MIFERPLLDEDDLVDLVDAIPERAEATFRWLRERSYVSDGIAVAPHGGDRQEGATHVFSSLNWDALRAARVSDWDLAREIATEATRLESGQLSRWVRALDTWAASRAPDEDVFSVGSGVWWQPERVSDRWARRTLRAAISERADVLSLVEPVAEATVAVRERLTDRLPPVSARVCRVWSIGTSLAEIRPIEEGVREVYEFFADEVIAAGLRLGDPVTVRHEAIAAGVAMRTLDPAVEIGTPEERSLGTRPLPGHVDALLDELDPRGRSSTPPPLRRVA